MSVASGGNVLPTKIELIGTRRRLQTAVRVKKVLAPAWSTDWIAPAARDKLKDFGIAPPGRVNLFPRSVDCPRCGAARTERVSEFGSTACKAHYRCLACLEPFDFFKPL